jgi:hypothetical protein
MEVTKWLNPCKPCALGRETVLSRHCEKLAAGSMNFCQILPKPSSRSLPAGKSERSIRMTLSLAFISPVFGGSRDGGSTSARVLHQTPDRPADALARAVARHRTARADSVAGRPGPCGFSIGGATSFRRRRKSLANPSGRCEPERGMSSSRRSRKPIDGLTSFSPTQGRLLRRSPLASTRANDQSGWPCRSPFSRRASSRRRSRGGCRAASTGRGLSIRQCSGPSNGASWGLGRPRGKSQFGPDQTSNHSLLETGSWSRAWLVLDGSEQWCVVGLQEPIQLQPS